MSVAVLCELITQKLKKKGDFYMNVKNLTTTPRIIAVLLCLTMLLGTFMPVPVTASPNNSNQIVFEHDGYIISYDVTNSWGNNQNISVTIQNTGNVSIENWMLAFDDFGGDITSIWSAELATSQGNKYIRNMGWNSDILPGSSVSFGYIY